MKALRMTTTIVVETYLSISHVPITVLSTEGQIGPTIYVSGTDVLGFRCCWSWRDVVGIALCTDGPREAFRVEASRGPDPVEHVEIDRT